MSETDVQAAIMVEATRLGHRLMRNNVGMATYKDGDGRITGKVAYGVGGKSSGDLVGWTRKPFLDRDGGGRWVSVYTMIETKYAASVPKENKAARKRREDQQKKIDAVIAAGGIAGFCNSVDDYHNLIGYNFNQMEK